MYRAQGPAEMRLAGYWCPYMEACTEPFVANRCTFESYFPVGKVRAGYAMLWSRRIGLARREA